MKKIRAIPHCLLTALYRNFEEVFSFHSGLNDKAFNTLCKEDPTFRKNLLLKIRGIMLISFQFLELLGYKSRKCF